MADLIRNKRNISLTVIGAEKETFHKINQSNIKIISTESNKTKLIKQYDDHNIFILPSFTEGHPMVLLEALARRRPVIIFDDISHVIGDKKGINFPITFPTAGGTNLSKKLSNIILYPILYLELLMH